MKILSFQYDFFRKKFNFYQIYQEGRALPFRIFLGGTSRFPSIDAYALDCRPTTTTTITTMPVGRTNLRRSSAPAVRRRILRAVVVGRAFCAIEGEKDKEREGE